MIGHWFRRVVIVAVGLALAYLWADFAYRETLYPELLFDPVEIGCLKGEAFELCRRRAMAAHERGLEFAYLITFGPPVAALGLGGFVAWRRHHFPTTRTQRVGGRRT